MSEPVVSVDLKTFPARAVPGAPSNVVNGPLMYGKFSDVSGAAGKIVLMDRGEITFLAKVNLAQQAGAVGVIIANNVPGAAVVFSLGAGASAKIPVVGVSQSDGLLLMTHSGSTAQIGPPIPVPPSTKRPIEWI